MRFGVAILAVLLGSGSKGPAPAAATPPFAITHVTLSDMRDGSARTDMTVSIRDGRIVEVKPAAPLPHGFQKVEGRGKFLIPGLWDMHVHLSWATSSALPALVANGVT